jgi:hypothetical protein
VSKYCLIVMLCLALAGVSGCAGINGENKTTTTLKDGTVIKSNITNEGAFYQAQIARAQARKPILVMKAARNPDGTVKEIKLTGVAELTVWGYDENRGGIKQHKNQYLEAVKATAGYIAPFATVVAMGDANEKLVKAMGGATGTHISGGVHQAVEDGAGASVIGDGSGNQANPITTTTETTTTTTTESPEAP